MRRELRKADKITIEIEKDKKPEKGFF